MLKYTKSSASFAYTEKGEACLDKAMYLAKTIVNAKIAGDYAYEMLYRSHLQDHIDAVYEDTGYILSVTIKGDSVKMRFMQDVSPAVFGLIKGRHEMPVDAYIFDKIENVFDFAYQKAVIDDILKNRRKITVYVTGLTSVTATLVSRCAHFGVALTLMHYDMASGGYIPQVMEF